MSRKCEVCGKGPMFGRKISHAHNLSNRVFYPNLHSVRVLVKGKKDKEKVIKQKVCAKCLKANKVVRV